MNKEKTSRTLKNDYINSKKLQMLYFQQTYGTTTSGWSKSSLTKRLIWRVWKLCLKTTKGRVQKRTVSSHSESHWCAWSGFGIQTQLGSNLQVELNNTCQLAWLQLKISLMEQSFVSQSRTAESKFNSFLMIVAF